MQVFDITSDDFPALSAFMLSALQLSVRFLGSVLLSAGIEAAAKSKAHDRFVRLLEEAHETVAVSDCGDGTIHNVWRLLLCALAFDAVVFVLVPYRTA